MVYLIASPERDVYGGDVGLSKAEFLEAKVKCPGFEPDKIYTSPKTAARQMALILFGGQGKQLSELDNIFYGKLEGKPRDGRTDDMFCKDPSLLLQYDGDDPYERGRILGKVLDFLKWSYKSRKVAVVTHKDLIEAAIKTPFSGTVKPYDILKW